MCTSISLAACRGSSKLGGCWPRGCWRVSGLTENGNGGSRRQQAPTDHIGKAIHSASLAGARLKNCTLSVVRQLVPRGSRLCNAQTRLDQIILTSVTRNSFWTPCRLNALSQNSPFPVSSSSRAQSGPRTYRGSRPSALMQNPARDNQCAWTFDPLRWDFRTQS